MTRKQQKRFKKSIAVNFTDNPKDEEWLIPWHEAAHKFAGESLFDKEFIYFISNDNIPCTKAKDDNFILMTDDDTLGTSLAYTLAGYSAEVMMQKITDIKSYVLDLMSTCKLADELGISSFSKADDMISYLTMKKLGYNFDEIINIVCDVIELNIKNFKEYWTEYLEEVKNAAKFFKIHVNI